MAGDDGNGVAGVIIMGHVHLRPEDGEGVRSGSHRDCRHRIVVRGVDDGDGVAAHIRHVDFAPEDGEGIGTVSHRDCRHRIVVRGVDDGDGVAAFVRRVHVRPEDGEGVRVDPTVTVVTALLFAVSMTETVWLL